MTSLKKLLYFSLRNFAHPGLLRAALRVHTERLNRRLMDCRGNQVLSGPFQGMQLAAGTSWGEDGDKGPKLLGTYESELHGVLIQLARFDYDAIVNIGCAEGYYAVGLARLMPKAKVYAFDIDEKASDVCKLAAETNKVSERVVVGQRCTQDNLEVLLKNSRRSLIVSDCEGAEATLLDPLKLPGLRSSDLLIETHDVSQPGCTALLKSRFAGSHHVTEIKYGARAPHLFAQLNDWREVDRWLLVNENRSEGTTWLSCISKLHST